MNMFTRSHMHILANKQYIHLMNFDEFLMVFKFTDFFIAIKGKHLPTRCSVCWTTSWLTNFICRCVELKYLIQHSCCLCFYVQAVGSQLYEFPFNYRRFLFYCKCDPLSLVVRWPSIISSFFCQIGYWYCSPVLKLRRTQSDKLSTSVDFDV